MRGIGRVWFLSSEAQRYRNISHMGKGCESIMTHRKHMVALDGEETLENALTFILEQNNPDFRSMKKILILSSGTIHLRGCNEMLL